MATLAVRTLRVKDFPALRLIGPRTDRLDSPLCRFRSSIGAGSRVFGAFPGLARGEHVFVATVDDELCAYVVAQEQPRRYQWELVDIAAGSPRLDATEDVAIELWTALIEFTVQQAGLCGVKRIFASAQSGSPAFESLRNNGFGAYENRFVLTWEVSTFPDASMMPGLRKQADSDVWSIHQLYHQITPRAVQFAEALTSTEWEADDHTWWQRFMTGSQQASFVLDGNEGVVGYCRIERRHGRAMARFVIAPPFADKVAHFLRESARLCGVHQHDVFQILVPGYAMEHIAALERCGFHVTWQREGMVKHTTAPVVVRPRLMPVPAADDRERAIRGAPTLFQGP